MYFYIYLGNYFKFYLIFSVHDFTPLKKWRPKAQLNDFRRDRGKKMHFESIFE